MILSVCFLLQDSEPKKQKVAPPMPETAPFQGSRPGSSADGQLPRAGVLPSAGAPVHADRPSLPPPAPVPNLPSLPPPAPVPQFPHGLPASEVAARINAHAAASKVR